MRMIQDEMDWLYWNRDRVDESDWWSWVDDQSDLAVVGLGEFWLSNLNPHNQVGSDLHLVASITHDFRHDLGITPRQRRAVLAAVREHWGDLRCGAMT